MLVEPAKLARQQARQDGSSIQMKIYSNYWLPILRSIKSHSQTGHQCCALLQVVDRGTKLCAQTRKRKNFQGRVVPSRQTRTIRPGPFAGLVSISVGTALMIRLRGRYRG